MKLFVCRWITVVDDVLEQDGRREPRPLRKVAGVAIVTNPYAGQRIEDLSALVAASGTLGEELAARAVAAMHPFAAESYGKGGVVGLDGEQEHVNALLTSTFADPLRVAVGGGKAWFASMTKRGAPGVSIDIPLAHKDALYVRSHYDGMTLTLPDAPQADEIAVILCLASRGRIGARVGGLAADDIAGQDGLR